MSANGEQDLLLAHGNLARDTDFNHEEAARRARRASTTRVIVQGALGVLFVVGLVAFLAFWDELSGWAGHLPKDPDRAAHLILKASPVIDGHIDLPILVRWKYSNNVSAVDLNKPFDGHLDIPRLRKGQAGGFFWSVYVGCPTEDSYSDEEADNDYLSPTWRVRDTLEQIDVAKLLIDKHSDTFSLARSATDVRKAMAQGKIASLLGVEGGHQLGNSIAVLRQYAELGVKYITLTHSCHNAFADSAGIYPALPPKWGGLSPLGYPLIDEMNRLGVLVDISHVSDDTARQALKYSKAPVIFSHSSTRGVYDFPRNVPDDILAQIGTTPDKKDAVVMVNFVPDFIAPEGKATLGVVADHVEHVAKIAGKKHVGIGSDFDGIQSTPVGLEDVSKYPALFAELYRRGWTSYELAGLSGGNLLRILDGAERVARDLQAAHTPPVMARYDKRKDL